MRKLLKRWWFWLWIFGLVVIIGTAYLLIPVNEEWRHWAVPEIADNSSKAKYDKIHPGMKASDVEDLLGCDWTDHQWSSNEGRDRGRWVITGRFPWQDEDGNVIEVTFDRNSVTGKNFTPTSLSPQELMKRRSERRVRALWP